MTREEAVQLARDVASGVSTSYVTAAIRLSNFLLAEEIQRNTTRSRLPSYPPSPR